MENCLIILNYNDANSCIKLTNKILNYPSVNKIIIVDNCSSDDSYTKLIKLKNKKVDIVRTKKNGGYSYGNNYGCNWAIKNYSPTYLTICNPDIFFEDSVLNKLINILELQKNNHFAWISCKMICESNPQLLSTWKLPTYSDCILNNLTILRKIIGDKTKYDSSIIDKNEPVEVDVLAGSFFVISTEAFKSINGFDEDTFLYNEENMLSKRLKKKGWKALYINYLSYYHFHSLSIDKSFSSMSKKLDLAYKSRFIYCNKYLKIGIIKKIFFVITYKIGKINYLFFKSLLNKK